LTAKCKKHGFFANGNGRSKRLGGKGLLTAAFPSNNMAHTLLENRILCMEDGYSEMNRDAYVPLMGNRYVR